MIQETFIGQLVCRVDGEIVGTRKFDTELEKKSQLTLWSTLYPTGVPETLTPGNFIKKEYKEYKKKDLISPHRKALDWYSRMPAYLGDIIAMKLFGLAYNKIDNDQISAIWKLCNEPSNYYRWQLEKAKLI